EALGPVRVSLNILRRQHEDVQRDLCFVNAARRIEPRSDAETDIPDVQGMIAEAGRFDQRPQSRLFRMAKRLQAVPNDDSVLADQWHDVRDSADGGQVE